MQDPLGKRRIVLARGVSRDPALADDMDVELYLTTRLEEHVKCKEGMTPAWFEIGPLKSEWVADFVEPVSSDAKRWQLCFSGACHRIEYPEGEKLARCHQVPGGQRVADTAWLTGVAKRHGWAAVREVGAYVWQLTQAPEGYEGPFF